MTPSLRRKARPADARAHRSRPRGFRTLVLALTLLAGACGGDEDGDATTTTDEATTTTEEAGASTSSSSTTAAAACAETDVPADAQEVAEASADVDGDGADDAVRSYVAGAWHLHVELAAGGGADVELAVFTGGPVTVLGGADVDGDGADEIWAQTGSGASASIVGLARFADCALQQVRFASGDPAELAVGGSVGSAAGLDCDAAVDPEADLTAYSAMHREDGSYDVTATEYALEGSSLVPRGAPTTSVVAPDDPAFARATAFTCDTLAL